MMMMITFDSCCNCGSINFEYTPPSKGYTEPGGRQLEPDDCGGWECKECGFFLEEVEG